MVFMNIGIHSDADELKIDPDDTNIGAVLHEGNVRVFISRRAASVIRRLADTLDAMNEASEQQEDA